ncbi:unnamed protein product [Soboliphyme baturini]|uniref:Ras family protein n=1 Tax=Soboliphyme baturini TaxID=241478 RepID=A0A183IKF1_9BILA|nr:unnamed protein product [Soboliphyme baturini]
MQVEHDKNAKDSVLVLDTCGLDAEAREIKNCYLQCADALIFVYSIDNQASFDVLLENRQIIERTLKERKDFCLAILGNKVDNEGARMVAKDAALLKWKDDSVANRDRIKIYEVTAKGRETLIEPFSFILSRLFPSQKESKFLLPRRKDKQPGAAIVIDI